MVTDNNFRVGVLGAGNSGAGLHLPVLNAMPAVPVAWICDLDIARAKRVAAKFNVPETFSSLSQCPNVNGIVMTIPLGSRDAAIDETLRNHWNVLVEKPFATTVANHEKILGRAKSAGVQIGIMLQRRAYHSTAVARKFIDSGILGPIKKIWAADAQPERRSGIDGEGWAQWQSDLEIAGGGILVDKGFHLIDHAFFMVHGIGLKNVKASLNGITGIDTEVRALAELTPETGAPFPIAVRLTRSRDLRRGIDIECERGTISVSNYPKDPVILSTPADREVCHLDADLRGAKGGPAAVHLQWEAFLQQCRTRKPTIADASSAVLTTKFIEDVYKNGVWNE